MPDLNELYDPDEWEEYAVGDLNIKPPEISPLEKLARDTRMHYAGMRVQLRVMERLLAEARDFETVVYWIAKIAEMKQKLGVDGDDNEDMPDL